MTICEAVARPSMRFVPVKSAEQQAALMLHRTRDLLIRQRTQLVMLEACLRRDAFRAHLTELGVVASQGRDGVKALIAIVADESGGRLPGLAREVLGALAAQLARWPSKLAPSTGASAPNIARAKRAGASKPFPAPA